MSKKVQDELYSDFKTLTALNKKIRKLLGVYYISDFDVIYGKSTIDFTERFVVVDDNISFDYLTNVLIDGDELYESSREVRMTGLQSRKEDDMYLITSPPRTVKDKEGKNQIVVEPEIVKIRQYPRTFLNELKPKFYKYLNHLDTFYLRALPYKKVEGDLLSTYCTQSAIDVTVDDYSLILDNSLFPDYNKPDYVPDLSVALVPSSVMCKATEIRDDIAFFMLKFVTPDYTSYSLVKTLVT